MSDVSSITERWRRPVLAPAVTETPAKGLCGACKRLLPLGAMSWDPDDFEALRCADRAACDGFRAPRTLPRSLRGPGSWLDEWANG